MAHSTFSGMLPGWISVTLGTSVLTQGSGPAPRRGHQQRGRSRVEKQAWGALSCKRGRCARSVHLARRPILLHGAARASPRLHCGSGSPGLCAGLSNLKLPGKRRAARGIGRPLRRPARPAGAGEQRPLPAAREQRSGPHSRVQLGGPGVPFLP